MRTSKIYYLAPLRDRNGEVCGELPFYVKGLVKPWIDGFKRVTRNEAISIAVKNRYSRIFLPHYIYPQDWIVEDNDGRLSPADRIVEFFDMLMGLGYGTKELQDIGLIDVSGYIYLDPGNKISELAAEE